MVTGDFNRDGKPDIAVAYSESRAPSIFSGANRIKVLLGNGDGSFTAKPIADALGPSMVLVAAADVNGDNQLDLIATEYFDVTNVPRGTIILLGKGDGTFQSPLTVSSRVTVRVADFNGDGKPDLLFRDLGVSLGKGDGTFGPVVSATPGSTETPLRFIQSIALGDFNGDGKLDLAFTSALHGQGGTVYVWLGKGDGTFSVLSPNTGFACDCQIIAPLASGDFNRDGKLDLALGLRAIAGPSPPSDGVGVLLGNGDGTFRQGPVSPASGHSYVVTDFNGDGIADLAADNSVALGKGDGTFGPQVFFGYGQRPPGPGSESAVEPLFPDTVTADFNRDGKPDLATRSVFTGVFSQVSSNLEVFLSSGVSVLLNDSPGRSNSVVAYSAASGSSLLAPQSLASLYGTNLSSETAAAQHPANLPTSLGGVVLHVRDASGVDRLAQLLYVSPSQMNFLVPAGTAEGLAVLNVDTGAASFVEGARATLVQRVAPGFFTADGTGSGVPAAGAVRISPDGSQTEVPVFRCSGPVCTAVPINLSGASPVYLTLYGTGFGNNVRPSAGCFLQGNSGFPAYATVTYAGPQNFYPGLDQVNLRLPQMLNSGELNLTCHVEASGEQGPASGDTRPVRISVK